MSTVAQATLKCLEAYRHAQTVVADQPLLHQLNDQAQSLDNWVRNMDVFGEPHTSLDYRIGDVEEIRTLFVQLLQTLGAVFIDVEESEALNDLSTASISSTSSSELSESAQREFCVPTDANDAERSPENDFADRVQQNQRLISQLQRLSNAVRTASGEAKASKVNAWWAHQCELEHAPIIGEIDGPVNKDKLSAKKVLEAVREFESNVVKLLHVRFPTSEPWLRHRVQKSMKFRRIRCHYFATKQPGGNIKLPGRQIRPLNEIAHQPTTSRPEASSVRVVRFAKQESSDSPPPPSVSRPSNNVPKVNEIDFRRPPTTIVSFKTSRSSAKDDMLLIPPCPATGTLDFTCPYCNFILPASEAQNRRWRQHVIQDLEPYVCIREVCPCEDVLYSVSEDWLQHLRSVHDFLFVCSNGEHPDMSFADESNYQEHLVKVHHIGVEEEETPLLCRINQVEDAAAFEQCPFCGVFGHEESTDKSKARQFVIDHVVAHLRELAVISLLTDDIPEDVRSADYFTESTKNSFRDTESVNDLPRPEFDDSDDYRNAQNPRSGLVSKPSEEAWEIAPDSEIMFSSNCLFDPAESAQFLDSLGRSATEGLDQVQDSSGRISNLPNSPTTKGIDINEGADHHRFYLEQWLGLRQADVYDYFEDVLHRWHPETGSWLLKGPAFESWMSSASSFMWLHGGVGCGKTTMSAAIVKTILQHHKYSAESTVGFFFFQRNEPEKSSMNQALRSLSFQFAQQRKQNVHTLLQLLPINHRDQYRATNHMIQTLLLEMVQLQKSTYIILDALDECGDRSELLHFIEQLENLRVGRLHLFVTSRRERIVERFLRPIVDFTIDMQRKIPKNDIKAYVEYRLEGTDWPDALRQEIITTLAERADGMFLWVMFQLRSVEDCLTTNEVHEVFSSLPIGLGDVYHRLLARLDSYRLEISITVLRWVCYAERPLRMLETKEVLAFQPGRHGSFDPNTRLVDGEDITLVVPSLLTYDTTEQATDGDDAPPDLKRHGGFIRLAHFSVKEYLCSETCGFKPDFEPRACHSKIAESCLHYLLYLSDQTPLTIEVVNQHPLAEYAAEFWWQHAQDGSQEDDVLSTLILKLLTTENALLTWLRLYNPDKPEHRQNLSLEISQVAQPLYYAAQMGFYGITKQLIDQGADLESGIEKHGPPLVVASRSGNWSVVDLLLTYGANPNNSGEGYGTALHVASDLGHVEGIQMLIESGADVNSPGGDYITPLQRASQRGHKEAVKWLLNAGADVNAPGWPSGTALQVASKAGHAEVVRILLTSGADINARREHYGTALQAASKAGHEEVVRILLNSVADVNAPGGLYYGTALQEASRNGHEEVVRILLAYGADVNAPGDKDGSALQVAAQYGHTEVVQLLLDAGADVRAQGEVNGTALQRASLHGHTEVVRMLIHAKADVDVGMPAGTPIAVAARKGHKEIVQLLLDAGVDVGVFSKEIRSSLEKAASDSDEDLAQILIDAFKHKY